MSYTSYYVVLIIGTWDIEARKKAKQMHIYAIILQ